MSAPMVGEQEQAVVNPSNTCPRGRIMFKSNSPEKPDSLIFTFLVTTEENLQLSQLETLRFNFENSSKVI